MAKQKRRKIVATCPSCKTRLRADLTTASNSMTCSECQSTFRIAIPKETDAEQETCDVPRVAMGGHDSLRKVSAFQRRFKSLEELGRGAFGVVYRARDTWLRRDVALKLPQFPANDTHRMKRFLEEARSAARLKHPNIVSVFDSGVTESGQAFIASEFIQGRTFDEQCSVEADQSNSATYVRAVVTWVRDIASALHYSHQQGIIHRDVKPENIIVADDRPQLMDFGLAKNIEGTSSVETQDGAILGTPAYMSPEQASGNVSSVGPPSDQFSLGVILYEALAGQRPFTGRAHEMLVKLSSDEELPRLKPRFESVTRDLVSIVDKSLRKGPSDRYESCEAFADDLTRWLNNEVVSARPIGVLERGFRWTKRNPVVASLSITVMAAISLGLFTTSIALGVATIARQRAEQASNDLADSLKEVTLQREFAESQERKAEEVAADLAESLKTTEEQRQIAASQKKRAQEEEAKAKALAKDLQGALDRIKQEQAQTLAERFRANTAETVVKAFPLGIRLRFAQGVANSDEQADRDAAKQLLGYSAPKERNWAWHFLNTMASEAAVPGREESHRLLGPVERRLTGMMDDPTDGSMQPRKVRVGVIAASVVGPNTLVCISPNGIVWSVELTKAAPKRVEIGTVGGLKAAQFDPTGNVLMVFRRYTNQGGTVVDFYRTTGGKLQRISSSQPFPSSTHDLHAELGLVAFQGGLRKFSGALTFSFPNKIAFHQSVRNFCFSRSGDYLAVLTAQGAPKQSQCQFDLYNTSTMNVVNTFKMQASVATRMFFSPADDWLYVSTGAWGPKKTVAIPVEPLAPDKHASIRPSNATVGSPHRLLGPQYYETIQFTPDGKIYFARRSESLVQGYDAETGAFLLNLNVGKGDFLSIGSDGRFVVSVDDQGVVHRYDAGLRFSP